MSGVITFIIILVALVLFHEFGHFIIAKLFRIRVDEFSIGFPPRIFKKKFGETTYSLGALLLGGYVKIFGESGEEVEGNEQDKSRSFIVKPRWMQASVIGAGVLFNFLLAWILLSFGYVMGMPQAIVDVPRGAVVSDQRLIIIDVAPDSPAAEAGLTAGDFINKVSHGEAEIVSPDAGELSDFVNVYQKDGVTIDYTRGAEEKEVSLVPVTGFVEGKTAIGVSLVMTGTVAIHSPRAILEGWSLTLEYTKLTWDGLVGFFGSLFTGSANFSEIRGPIGIVEVVSDESALGFVYLLIITAIISINLAIINLIPIPALDGGRLLFIFIEAIVKKPIGQTRAVLIAQGVSFALLILLLLIVSYHDIVRIVGG